MLKSSGKLIARFDCFGKHTGHYHLPSVKSRIYFIEPNAIRQIEVSREIALELISDHSAINSHGTELEEIMQEAEKVMDQVTSRMKYYIENRKELSPLKGIDP